MTQGTSYISLAEVMDGKTAEELAWDGSKGSGPLPGTYRFQIGEAAETASQGKNTPQIEVQFTVAEDLTEGRENPDAMVGKTMKGWYAMTSKAVGRLLHLMASAGVTLDKKGGFDLGSLIGCEIIADVVEEQYKSNENPVSGEATMKTALRLIRERAVEQVAPPPPAKTKQTPNGRQTQRA